LIWQFEELTDVHSNWHEKCPISTESVVLVTEGDLCWSDLAFFAQIFHYFVLIVNTLACLCNLFIEVLCFDNQASLVRLQFKAVQVLIRREEPRVK